MSANPPPTIRSRINQERIAHLVGVSRPTVCQILNGDPKFRCHPETRRRVWEVGRRLGYSLSQLRRIHRRRDPRRTVTLPVQVAVWPKKGPLWDKGVALLKDFSHGGGLLTALKLSRGSLPATPFRLRIEGPPPVGKRVGQPVRWQMNGSLAIGLRWRGVPPFSLSRRAKS